MSDEQTIYISPEDDLTTVRERLEEGQTRKVTLVVPAHTQLRSHVAWKLLYARARELGKDVLIVSSDPQVRSVAHAVKFTVAHSLESSQQGHSRPTNARPTRTRTTNPGQRANPTRSTRSTNGLRTRQQDMRPWQESEQLAEEREEQQERIGYSVPGTQQDDRNDEPQSAIFRAPDEPYGTDYEYRLNTTPPIRPISPEQIEEPDLLLEDYTQAQDIRLAAGESSPGPQQKSATADLSDPDRQKPKTQKPKTSKSKKSQTTSRPLDTKKPVDPFAMMEDKQQQPSLEQQGNAVVEDQDAYEHVIQDVAELPTSIIGHHFNFEDDPDEIISPAPRSGRGKERPVAETRPKQPELQQMAGERERTQNPRPRRSGQIKPAQAPVQHVRPVDIEDDDLLPVEDRPTRVQERETFAYETPSRSAHKNPDLIPLPRERQRNYGSQSGSNQASLRPASSGSLRPQRPATARPFPEERSPQSIQELRSRKPERLIPKTRKRRSNVVVWLVTAIVILLLLAILFAGYALPSTTAVITIATRSYAHPVSVIANLHPQAGALPAQALTQEFSKKGQESATGSKLIGTAKAKGNVCFSNATNSLVTIPNGSIVATGGTNGVLFKTTAEVVIPKQATCPNNPLPDTVEAAPDPIEAVNPGETGNQPAGALTVIPPASLESIAKDNNSTPTNLKLSVINSDAIKGGGMAPVPAVAAKDLDSAKTDLHKQLQKEIDAWIQQLSKDGVTGKVITTDTLINPPTKDTIIDEGKTFPAELKVTATVLFVKNADIAKAAQTQLESAIKKEKAFTGDVLLSDSQHPIQIGALKQQNTSNTTMQLDFTATARAAGAFDKETLKNAIKGTSPATAKHILETSGKDVQHAEITMRPDFFWFVALNSNNIEIKVVPGTTASGK